MPALKRALARPLRAITWGGVLLGLLLVAGLATMLANDHHRRLEAAQRQSRALAVGSERLLALESRWADEKALVDELLATRKQLRDSVGVVDSDAAGDHGLRERLVELQQRLGAVQGETPLILPTVDYQAVASVVADWTGIPVGRMARNEIDTVLRLDDRLRVTPSPALYGDLKALLGPACLT